MIVPKPVVDVSENDSRLRCILCESLLPPPPDAASDSETSPVCVQCSALAPDDRQLLSDLAMARALRRNLTR